MTFCDPEYEQRYAVLRAALDEAQAQSSAALKTVARHTPLQTRAMTDAALALQSALSGRRPSNRPPPPPPPSGRLSILVVEDDPEMLKLLVALFRRTFKVQVYGAEATSEARHLWDTHKCAVVMADMDLGPGEGGDAFLRSLPPTVLRGLISGRMDTATLRTTAERAGAEGCWWRKGPDVESLLRSVRGLIEELQIGLAL